MLINCDNCKKSFDTHDISEKHCLIKIYGSLVPDDNFFGKRKSTVLCASCHLTEKLKNV